MKVNSWEVALSENHKIPPIMRDGEMADGAPKMQKQHLP